MFEDNVCSEFPPNKDCVIWKLGNWFQCRLVGWFLYDISNRLCGSFIENQKNSRQIGNMSIAKRKLKWYQKLMTEATAISTNSDDDEWWWIVFMVWLTNEKHLALFLVGTIVRDPQHRESPIRRKQDLNFVEWSCAVVIMITTTPRHHAVRDI